MAVVAPVSKTIDIVEIDVSNIDMNINKTFQKTFSRSFICYNFKGDVDAQTIEEYLELEKKIANAETLR